MRRLPVTVAVTVFLHPAEELPHYAAPFGITAIVLHRDTWRLVLHFVNRLSCVAVYSRRVMGPRASYRRYSDSRRGPSPFNVEDGNLVGMHTRRRGATKFEN